MSQTNTLIAISIHSLVKRETQWQHEPCLYGWHFNPLPRKEGDHRSQRVPCPVGDFNPLPRKEGDLNLFWMPDDTLISIHSLVKRETTILGDGDVPFLISIHSLVKRET